MDVGEERKYVIIVHFLRRRDRDRDRDLDYKSKTKSITAGGNRKLSKLAVRRGKIKKRG